MSRRPPAIEVTRTLSGEKTEKAEDPARSALLGGAYTAAFSATSLSASQQKIDGIEDKLSVPINQSNDTYTTLQTFYTANAAVINTASSALAATANIDVKSIEATIARFAETSAVIMKGLDALGAVHPFVGVAVTAFKLVISLDITRRQNNKKVLAVKLQMQDLMTVLFQLRFVRDPEDKAPDGTTLKDRMSELMKTVAGDITSCAKTIKSKIYEARLASYVANFTDHKKSIAFALTMHTSLSVDTANRKLDDQTTQLHSIEVKMEALFRKLDTPREREVQRFLDENGGARACISDEAALAQLVVKSGDTTLASSTSAQITATKKLLTRELAEDVDEAFRKNERLFDRKMELQSQQLEAAIGASEERIVSVLMGGAHERIMNADLQTLWKDQGWKGSVKARYFVLALNDYYSELFSQHDIAESIASSVAGSPVVSPIDVIAELAGVEEHKHDDRWALKYINVTHIQSKPILETVDDDGTGFVSIKEANEFAQSRPDGCRHVISIIAFILRTENKQSTVVDSVLGRWLARLCNLAQKPDLFATQGDAQPPNERAEAHLTRKHTTDRDKDLTKVREEIQDYENKRIQDQLDTLGYELDDAGLRLITGNKRIERFIYPLLNALLKRHFDILRLACVHVLDDGDFDTMTGSLGVIFKAVDERVANLEAVFKSNFSNVNERFGGFAFGMFQAGYTRDKTTVDVAKNSIVQFSRDDGFEFDTESEDTDIGGYSLDIFKKLDDKREDILMYPTADGVDDAYDFHLKHPDPPAEAGDHLALAGRWTGHLLYDGHADEGTISLVLSVGTDNTLSGAGENFVDLLEVSGSVTPGEGSKTELTLTISWPDGYSAACSGHYDPESDTIAGHLVEDDAGSDWDSDSSDDSDEEEKDADQGSDNDEDSDSESDANTNTFIFHRTSAESYRFRPSPTAENRAVARWHFAISAVLDQVQRRNMSWRWLNARFAERRRFIHLMTRDIANDRDLTPWAALSDDDLAELRNLKAVLTSADARFYNDAVERELSEAVEQERDCNVCHKHIMGSRLFCVQCMDDSFYNCADFCEPDMDKPAKWGENITHAPSHVSVKTIPRLHDGDTAWLVPEAKTVAARIKKQFKDLDAPESAKTKTETGHGAKKDLVEKKKPKCVCCAKEVSLPVWVCLSCVEDIFVCVECDKAKRPIPEDSGTSHLLSEPLVYVHDPEPIPSSVKSGAKEDPRVAELDRKISLMEQRMTGIEEKLDSIIKVLIKDGLSSDA
ncbi:unnamed protein product [Mycena citricolor]|uniref:EF-hand domain-containing protein n=1 Tax=Mycena citricolor TaxID=2018698 RepID=A0AAD2HB69_9AGAR|nr:unnamed protein product [Mycena citricolor]